jgi:hypothetical protein
MSLPIRHHFKKKQLSVIILLMVFQFIWGTDQAQSAEGKKKVPFESDKSQVQEKKRKRPGETLFDHPGFSISSLNEPPRPVTERVTVNNYFCEIKKSDDGEKVCVTFYRFGKKIRSDCLDSSYADIFIATSPPPGTDINGDGIPDLIVEYYTGGMHCCYGYGIFSLGNTLKLTDVLKGEHSPFEFKDLDGDRKYEAIGRDWTFAYWNASMAGSPAPEIILQLKDGRYRLAENMMKKPPPDHNELLELAAEFKGNALFYDESMQSLHWEAEWWAVMLELIYTGNGDLAWKFCDWFWPVSDQQSISKKYMAEKKKFLAEFKKQLKTSPFWPDLKKLNGWR